MQFLGFTGTQGEMTSFQRVILFSYLKQIMPEWVHHGCCIGSDAYCNMRARELGIKTWGHPSNIVAKVAPGLELDMVDAPKAPLVRNGIIARCEYLLATPKQDHEVLRSGTWATIRTARSIGRPGRIILPDGYVVDLAGNAVTHPNLNQLSI